MDRTVYIDINTNSHTQHASVWLLLGLSPSNIQS